MIVAKSSSKFAIVHEHVGNEVEKSTIFWNVHVFFLMPFVNDCMSMYVIDYRCKSLNIPFMLSISTLHSLWTYLIIRRCFYLVFKAFESMPHILQIDAEEKDQIYLK